MKKKLDTSILTLKHVEDDDVENSVVETDVPYLSRKKASVSKPEYEAQKNDRNGKRRALEARNANEGNLVEGAQEEYIVQNDLMVNESHE